MGFMELAQSVVYTEQGSSISSARTWFQWGGTISAFFQYCVLQIFVTPEQNRKEITHTNHTSSVVSLHNFPNCAVQNLKRPIRSLGCISCGWSKPFLSSNHSRLGIFIDHNQSLLH
ncbi:hypothetical protein EZV62_014139 [Acer yangbiense]|uniref:Uncharacterized protein n=1 Tax=Acer yangbiense TaxID=1000413 RepID=A0A5C7HTC9_9ROSI|nr:hypothetical protein EZV62_014139 [Acer yangbiense]